MADVSDADTESLDAIDKKRFFQRVRGIVKKINAENIKKLSKSERFIRWLKRIIIFIIVAHLFGIAINYINFKLQFWDNDKNRGAIAVKDDLFDESFSVPEYLNQGWSPRDSLWFYNTSQGSDLIPYDFFMALEQIDSMELFRSNDNIKKYRYLLQKKTYSNPDALPVGFVKDRYKGKEYLGFTCAACHTSQINYTDTKTGEKKAIRIDGAPAQSDLDTFIVDMSDAIQETLNNDAKKQRFIKQVLTRNGLKKIASGGRNYANAKEIEADLQAVSRKLISYNWINRSDTSYGYSRLDAFGRIYNRIVEHVFDIKTLHKVLSEFLAEEKVNDVIAQVNDKTNNSGLHLLDATLSILTYPQQEQFFDRVFSRADGPVSYPYLWDIPYHDYLQWNGIVNNAGPGALGRNVGQVIGVFGTLDWKVNDAFSLSDLLRRDKSTLKSVDFHSSINIRNLYRVENQLKKLISPRWPEDKLGKLDKTRMIRGEKIYKRYCLVCHNTIERTNPKRRITAHISSLENIGTDPKMAVNSISKTAYTGLIQGSHVDVPVGSILLQEKAPVALLVMSTTESVLKTPDIDANFLVRWSNWIYDLFFSYVENPIKSTIKTGDYNPDTEAQPFASLLSYKARPLNGIWATAPYLHNGSVPTLYDLLLPKKKAGDPVNGQYRPDRFKVGSRAFDRNKVGFLTEGYDGFVFDTSQQGNSNSGHEYASGNTALPNGKVLPALNNNQRLDLLEYLKGL